MVLSLNKCRIIGKDLKKFSAALAQNQHLKALILGRNNLGDIGVNYIASALRVNSNLTFLDLFDVDFEKEGAIVLAEALSTNKSLFSLRLANTHVSATYAELLLK